MVKPLRVGLIGAGANMKARHIPGFRAIPGVEIVAVCNRRETSTAAVARDFGVPRTFARWEDMVADPDVDALVIGTWPYLHCPITLAALQRGKHVLTEARMSRSAAEAHKMLEASRRHPRLVTQIVPSPFGLKGHDIVADLIRQGFLGEIREVQVFSLNGSLADPAAPLSWRQDTALSGYNTLALGIVHETLLRWAAPPVRVLAQAHAFLPARIDPESGVLRPVGTPDSMQVLAILENGARAVYHLSGATPFGQRSEIFLYGTDGVLHYDLATDRIRGASKLEGQLGVTLDEMRAIPIPENKARVWQVEADFVDAIRTGKAAELTDFVTGMRYMEFTEAVARSARLGKSIDLPLEEFEEPTE